MIQTVQGLIPPEQLGFCHSHEHLFLAEGQPEKLNPALRIDDYTATLSELEMFQSLGGKAIVDAQPLGCGRMEKELVKVSSQTKTHIVASTGFHKLAFYPHNHWIRTFSMEELKEVFIHELTVGMYIGTDSHLPKEYINHKAGQIKTAIDEKRMKDSEKKWFIAAAQASIETSIPIMCHTETVEQGDYLTDLYIKLGVPPRNIIVCHLDRKLDNIGAHKKIAEKGCFVEYDTIGRFKYHDDELEVEMLKQMLEWGFADAILLGLDTTRQRLKSYGGEIGLNYIIENFIPLMHRRGISQKNIEKFMIKNPAIAFSKI
ncbi:phosphotriesterase [Oceanobacillus oncorhynchi]|uniref:phosphotriesterase n=1 Tax=Oceanobacillus oncorhynchi TaxID=545501 RepID=UPI0034D75189